MTLAELGSFTKTASKLKQPKSRVSRHIASLERDLGVELVRRTTRQTTLTQAGREFFQRISTSIHTLDNEVNLISDHSEELSGLIRMTAPEDMALTIVKDVILEFEAEYPKVCFELNVSNDYLDLVKENLDFAFRAGKLKDSNYKQRKLMDTKIILVASKEYLQMYGRPYKLQDLERHRLLTFSSIGFDNFGKKELELKPVISCDSFPVLKSLALDNKGIAIVPEFFA